jgi:hypothetical protein
MSRKYVLKGLDPKSKCIDEYVLHEYMAWVVKGFIAKKKGIERIGLRLKGENNEHLIRVHLMRFLINKG